ncbi:hypothetical protein Syun_012365 [Stephania yunnanensis]|uniref:Uncharacterized protein n=1 Tax=Stephania yunnanensis TaxID=152371 RepID=A0AAP0K1J5_9MAGN
MCEIAQIMYRNYICLDVETRWNSTYLMLETSMKFQKIFEMMEYEDHDYLKVLLSEKENGALEPSEKEKKKKSHKEKKPTSPPSLED